MNHVQAAQDTAWEQAYPTTISDVRAAVMIIEMHVSLCIAVEQKPTYANAMSRQVIISGVIIQMNLYVRACSCSSMMIISKVISLMRVMMDSCMTASDVIASMSVMMASKCPEAYSDVI